MTQKTPQEARKNEIEVLILSFLKKDAYTIKLLTLDCFEDFQNNKTITKLTMSANNRTDKIDCSGTGVGVIHSLFLCLKELYAPEFSSLENINLFSFVVNTRFDTAESFEKTDAYVEVIVEFKNVYGAVTPFRATTSSLLKSAAAALVSAIQFYINSEKAFLGFRELIDDADVRQRPDIKTDLVYKITKIVGVSSYEELVR